MAVPRVELVAPVVALGRLCFIPPFEIPGITAADAFDVNDAFGTTFSVAVPLSGAFVKAIFHDRDAESLNKELWIFNADPTDRMAASDAAFSVNDLDNPNVVDVLTFDGWSDGVASDIGVPLSGLPSWYFAPARRLWMALKTNGVDNIAAGSMPRLSFVIEKYDETP